MIAAIKKKNCCTVLFSLFIVSIALAQPSKYWVFFKDKKGVSFNPYDYFDSKAIERRKAQCLPLADTTDFPVNPLYVATVQRECDSAGYVSRWLNAMVVYANPHQVEAIKRWPFVKNVQPILLQSMCLFEKPAYDTSLITYELHYQSLIRQTGTMKGEEFQKNKLNGKGLRIAVFDAGFPGVDRHPVFAHLRVDNRIKATYDFVRKRTWVFGNNAHGAMVLSCIAGIVDGKPMGLATGAEFLLARTENSLLEPYSEEENWVAAAEWADKNGADIINSSLGYTYHRYFVKDMDGRTALISKAANIAARKGILVINAAGNEGNVNWKYISAPADADSVLTVGGINPEQGIHIGFSSYGPTSDGRLKPNVCAAGEAVVAGKKALELQYGTSFSSPLIAGFAACAWQHNRNLTNMEVFREIEKSGHLYPYYDYAHGYGIPQASYFTMPDSAKKTIPTFDFIAGDGIIKIKLAEKLLTKNGDSNYLYYHLKSPLQKMLKYAVVTVEKSIPLILKSETYEKGTILVVHYNGYTAEYVF